MNCPYDLSGKVSCSMPLYIFERGKRFVPTSSGLNWGLAALSGSHVNIDDAYIRISTDLINRFPDLFPPKLMNPTNYTNVPKPNHRDNDDITIVWDDGTRMTALLEGSVPVDTDSGRLI